MSSSPKHDAFPEALASIRAALGEFQQECAGWQREVEDLFDDLLDSLGSQGAAGGQERILAELAALGRTLRDEQQCACERQAQMLDEMAALRQFAERSPERLNAVPAESPGPLQAGA